MKKNDWILLASVATYSYLFYNQNAGINWLVFNLILIILLLSRNKDVYKNKNWLFAASGSIISATCITYYGNGLSIIANIISLGILSAYSINSKTSVILSFLFSCYSVVASFVFMIIDSIRRNKNKSDLTETKPVSVKLMLYLVPLLIAIVFFFMYKAANPVFDNFTKKINLDFITLSWFFFTFGGLFLMYGFFYHKTIKSLEQKDQNATDSLYPEMIDNSSTFARLLTIDNEKLSGIILFILLNTLLLSVNIIDVHFLWFDGVLPKELSYSAFVHQGTGALITSIIIAILVILFYFRGELNFHSGNKLLKLLACLWVIQNAFMIISTAYRNNLYINEYSLTYKRIGVYVWLLLVLIGLITTFIKILKAKSNWYLFRTNGWMFYCVLLASCFINWDVIVTDFNIHQAEQKHKALDELYLTDLSEKNIPQLLSFNDSRKAAVIDAYSNEKNLDFSYLSEIDKPELHRKLYCFLEKMQQQQWQSFCVEKSRVLSEIEFMKKNITEINLENLNKTSLRPLASLDHLTDLNFSNNLLTDFNELQIFPALETLYLNSNSLGSIKVFPVMKNLKTLLLADNDIRDLSHLKNAPNLLTLNLSGNTSLDLKTLPQFKKLNSLSISNCGIYNIDFLKNLEQLEILDISNNAISDFTPLFNLKQLKQLTIGKASKQIVEQLKKQLPQTNVIAY